MSDPRIYHKEDGTIVAVAMNPLVGDDIPPDTKEFSVSSPEATMFQLGITPTDAWKIVRNKKTQTLGLKKMVGVRTNQNRLVVIGQVDDPELKIIAVLDFMVIVPQSSWKPSRTMLDFYVTAQGDPNVLIEHISLKGDFTDQTHLCLIPTQDYMILTHPGIRVSYEKYQNPS